MPLIGRVSFKGQIQRRNGMVQVPRMIRWQFKMEPDQVLRVGVNTYIPESASGPQHFYAKMRKDGRIIVPKLVVMMLQGKAESMLGYVLEVTLEPA